MGNEVLERVYEIFEKFSERIGEDIDIFEFLDFVEDELVWKIIW